MDLPQIFPKDDLKFYTKGNYPDIYDRDFSKYFTGILDSAEMRLCLLGQGFNNTLYSDRN